MKLNDLGIVVVLTAIALGVIAYELHKIAKEDPELAPVAEVFEHCAEAEADYLLEAPAGTTQHLIEAEDALPDLR